MPSGGLTAGEWDEWVGWLGTDTMVLIPFMGWRVGRVALPSAICVA